MKYVWPAHLSLVKVLYILNRYTPILFTLLSFLTGGMRHYLTFVMHAHTSTVVFPNSPKVSLLRQLSRVLSN